MTVSRLQMYVMLQTTLSSPLAFMNLTLYSFYFFLSPVSFFGGNFIVNNLIFHDGHALMYIGWCETWNFNYSEVKCITCFLLRTGLLWRAGWGTVRLSCSINDDGLVILCVIFKWCSYYSVGFCSWPLSFWIENKILDATLVGSCPMVSGACFCICLIKDK